MYIISIPRMILYYRHQTERCMPHRLGEIPWVLYKNIPDAPIHDHEGSPDWGIITKVDEGHKCSECKDVLLESEYNQMLLRTLE